MKRANIFIEGINLAQGLMGYNYIQTPHYPLQDRCVRFGVSWRFFD
ncbi:MAG: putative porin [Bacteroidales bacterium]|nr:putative porin [Bacteroidales bacterium]